MAISFDNKIAIVTGAGGGIGAATARRLAGLGAKVALTDINMEALEAVTKSMTDEGLEVFCSRLDVTDYDAFLALVDAVVTRWGGVDILANVAGGGVAAASQPIELMEVDAWRRNLELNLSGPLCGMKAVIGPMRARGGGAIVTVGSLASIRMSTHGGAAYTAAKSGILGLTRHAGFEFARDNVRVTAVLPGIVDGELMKKSPPEATNQARSSIPLGEMTTNEQIADAIAFLASDMAAGITGEYLVVDGGMQIGSPTSSKIYFEARERRLAEQG
ncbi:hypothetical protein ASE06_06115 [Sphingopyxis sp. Root214]|uniref:SDR family NAD(P)-dependent oxidoreductase n=1 Tax=unclassified Sphingopyxis TaxID=2614943 RepID=UPI0006F7CC62|nr:MULTISPECIES: SDR family NAD(P)-dependent oxidoreductase [unclassified Sphingopyxis]KQZ76678.1 hypothetical protein ASD73_01880 [Sphingopyxis sp. Root154]KRC09435.1 hypothetical protein ASE06_06115 [Sphingopyxis sp. Root214]